MALWPQIYLTGYNIQITSVQVPMSLLLSHCLRNALSFVIRDASSLYIFKKNINELNLAMVN